MKKIILNSIVVIILFSCKSEKNEIATVENKFDKIKQLEWLIGDWSNVTEESQSYEKWKFLNDSTLTSFACTLVASDTVFAETMVLQQLKSQMFLTVNVPGQNDAASVTFELISSEKGTFSFENKQHDFPSKITYSNPVKDSIHAWIEGVVEGETKKIDFFFKRD